MTLKDMMARDLSFAIAQMPEPFLHKGKTYIGAIDQTSNKGKEDFEGLLDTGAACEITVMKSAMPTAPALKDIVTVRGKGLRVAAVGEDAAAVAWTITLVGLNG
jgi:hypothetical protein